MKKIYIIALLLSVALLIFIVIEVLSSYFKIIALLAWFHTAAQPLAINEPAAPAEKEKDLCSCVIGVCHPLSTQSSNYIFDQQIYDYRCDTLPQVIFWQHIMNLHKDSSLVCIGQSRKIIYTVHNKDWGKRSDSLKHAYRDSVRIAYRLDSASHILVTPGKQFFYAFDKAFANFDRGINDFVENGVDPWYAQAILLIESPNKLQKSNVGAYGPFQLMKEVARLFGLKVNKQVDERADFDRSAYAASSLIKTICIPYTRQILDSLHITYNETDLWFRLLVMHSYHAGAGNVKQALYTFMPTKGDMNLIYNLWHATTRHFKSASQNYSQLVLASMIEMNRRIKFPPHVEQKIAEGGR